MNLSRTVAAVAFLATISFALSTAFSASGSQPDASETWDVTHPRGKVRTIDFTTTEGTGMSVDISPDGKWLVFDLLSQIYRVPVAGGDAQCLTQSSGIALNYHPRISPDGRQIAFISDRAGQNNLWVMNADGSNPRSIFIDLDTTLAEPAWTPDGRAVVAVRYYPHALGPWTRTNRLWMFPLDGAKPAELPTSANTLVYSPSVSPDGRYVYYHSSSMPVIAEGYYKVGTAHQLRRLELARGIDELFSETYARRYYHREPFYAFAPSVSPDGKWLAFSRRVPGGSTHHQGVTYAQRSGLWLRNLETGVERLVIDGMTPDQLETHTMYQIRLLPGYAWSHDSASIVYSEGGQLRRSYLQDRRVETIPFRAHVTRSISELVRPASKLTDNQLKSKFPRWPALSPDGKRLAFEAAGSIWLKTLPSGRAQRLAPASSDTADTVELAPAWSPDGQSLAYTTWDDAEGGHVWTVRVDKSTSPKRLTNDPGEYLHPAWSPDGRAIVVARGSGAGLRGEGTGRSSWNDLVLIAADGQTRTSLLRVRPGGEGFIRPTFARDGRIYFLDRLSVSELQRSPRAHGALRSIGMDGASVTTLATFPRVTDAAVSPDGKWVALSDAESVFMAPLAATGGDAISFIDRSVAAAQVRELGTAGGFHPRWSANGKLLFVSGPRVFAASPGADAIEEWPLDIRIDRPDWQSTIAFTNARILTFDDRRVIERGSILVRGHRIVGVGEVDTSKADRVIDLQGKTVMPGLIDVHAHHHSGSADGEIIPSHRAESANYLAYGVTTTFDPAAPSQLVFPAAELSAAGKLLGPRVFSTGETIMGAAGTLPLQSYDHARKVSDRLASWGALGLKQYFQPRRAQRQWVSEAARARGDVFVTGEGMDFAYNLSMIMDGQTAWEHPILDIPLYSDVTRFMAQAGVVYNPELITPGQGLYMLEYFMSRANQTEDPKQRRWVRWEQLMRKKNQTQRPLAEYPAVLSVEAVKDIVRAGGEVGVGGHGQEHGLGTHWEMWTLAGALQPVEVLEAATIRNARYLGLDRDLGSISTGKLADLVILEADPLADIRNSIKISHVMMDGRLFVADSLDEIWPRSRPYGIRRWTLEYALSGASSSARQQ